MRCVSCARSHPSSSHDLTPCTQGVGRIVAIGQHTQNSPVKIGDRVGIKWLAYSCLDCEPCRKGLEQSQSSRACSHIPAYI